MTFVELEKEVQRLKIQMGAVIYCLTQHDTLPILGAGRNFEDFESVVHRETEEAHL